VTVQADEDAGKKESVSFAEGLKAMVTNKYWLLMVCNLFFMFFMMSIFFGTVLFFTKYNMGNENQYAMVANLLSGTQIVTLFITPFLMKKISKRYLNMSGMAIVAVACAMGGMSTSYGFICVTSVLKGIGFGFAGSTMFGCLQDAITYGEWKSGCSAAGMGNAASSFCMKIGSGLGTAAMDRGCIEGPHLTKRSGYYYIMCAEGGTGYNHCVTMGRAKDVWGPYEKDPCNPIVTSAPDNAEAVCGREGKTGPCEDPRSGVQDISS